MGFFQGSRALLVGLALLVVPVGAQSAAASPGFSQHARVSGLGENGHPFGGGSSTNVDYDGGPVSHSMTGVIVDWGPNVNSAYTDESNGDPGLIKYLAANSGATTDIGGVMAQYMDSSGHNAANAFSYGNQYEITPSVTATTIGDAQVQTELVNQIQAGNLPAPSGNGLQTIYLVLFPAGDTECMDQSEQECSGSYFCAYHAGTTLPDGTNVLYAVVPDDTTGAMSQGCGNASTPFENQTSYLSHEWAETVTDPLGTAWWNSNRRSPSYGNEIADNCNGETTANGPWTVQLLWSNVDRNCVSGEAAFLAPTATFLAPATAGAGQSIGFDASGSTDPSGNRASASFGGSSYSIPARIASYQWNWGDGSSSASTASATAAHAYAATGTYQVSLTVADDLGFTSTVTKAVEVSASPPTTAPQAATGSASAISPIAAPAAATLAASRVSSSGAIVLGYVNPNGSATTYLVEFGNTTQYGHSTTPVSVSASRSGAFVSVALTGLSPRVRYHYRIVASNAGGTTVGTDRSFLSARRPAPPPRFSFRIRARTSVAVAEHGRLTVRFTCSSGCTARFSVMLPDDEVGRIDTVPLTLAKGSGRIRSKGSGTTTITFIPAVRKDLARYLKVKLVVSGYAISRGSAPSAPLVAGLTLT